jgi:hypothetical protein
MQMNEVQALQLAIDTMSTEAYLAEPMARDWRKYGDALQFQQTESRMAAERADRLTAAAAVLQTMLDKLTKDTTP